MSKSINTVESTNPKDKYGRQKPPLHLIPAAGLLHESQAMALGAAKYGPYNWRDKTVSATVYVSAALRHLYQFLDGEDYDSESGAHHLGHGRACLGILLDATEQGMLVDDRPIAGSATRVIRELTTTACEPEKFDFAAAHAEASDEIDRQLDATESLDAYRGKYAANTFCGIPINYVPVLPGSEIVLFDETADATEQLNQWLTDRDVALADERGEIQPVKDSLFNVAYPKSVKIDTDAWLKRDNSMNSIATLIGLLLPFRPEFNLMSYLEPTWGTEKVEQFPDADAAAELDRTLLRNAGASADVVGQIIGGTTYQDDLTAPYAYVAGPMRGYPEFNFPAFDDGALTLGALGYTTISPAEIDRASGIDESQHKTGDGTVFDQRTFVYRDFFALWLVAHRPGGAIAMLPGWEKSTGAVGEFFLARWLGLKVLDARTGDPLKLDGIDIYDLLNALKMFLIGNAK